MGSKKTRSAATPDPQPRLIGLAGAHRGHSFIIQPEGLVIGRISASDVCIRDPYVSRHHATIVKSGEVFILKDLKSRNGTLVNGSATREHTLRDGDEISIGSNRYVFLADADAHNELSAAGLADIQLEAEPGRTITLRASIAQADEPTRLGANESYAEQSTAIGSLSVDRREKNVAAIHRMAQLMVSDIDHPALFRRLSDTLLECFQAGRACVLLKGSSSGQFGVSAASFRSGTGANRLPLSKTIIDQVSATKTALLCRDASSDPRFADAASVSGMAIRSVLCAPLIRRGEVLGMLYVDDQSVPREFDEEDLQLVSTVAGQAAVVVENHSLLAGLRQRVLQLEEQVEESEPLIVANSAVMSALVATARKAADSNATILLQGESGTGKEVLARSIHRWSQRSSAPFVVVNCAALVDQLLQSDLFGHERGAFTGAVRQKRGRLELGSGGTVFLDEIGELSGDLQSKLLRFLETREFERVGGVEPIKVDVRMIAASNRDLTAEVQARRFREDLYFRLRVIEIRIPPLRERDEDVLLLAEQFLQNYAQEMARAPKGFTRDAKELIKHYQWPGNVRELRNAVERAVVLGSGDEIAPQDLGLAPAARAARSGDEHGYHAQVRELKRQVIRDALESAGGVRKLAAERLGIQATYLSRLMANLGMR